MITGIEPFLLQGGEVPLKPLLLVTQGWYCHFPSPESLLEGVQEGGLETRLQCGSCQSWHLFRQVVVGHYALLENTDWQTRVHFKLGQYCHAASGRRVDLVMITLHRCRQGQGGGWLADAALPSQPEGLVLHHHNHIKLRASRGCWQGFYVLQRRWSRYRVGEDSLLGHQFINEIIEVE